MTLSGVVGGCNRAPLRLLGRIGGLALFLSTPFWGLPNWNVAGAVSAYILGIAAASVAILFDKGGMLSLGNALFMGLSAYTTGILVSRLSLDSGVGALIGMLAVVIGASALGWILVRVSGFLFTLGTLALAAAFEGLVRAEPSLTGGATGLVIERRFAAGPIIVQTDVEWYWLSVAVALSIVALLRHLSLGKTQRLLKLLKSDQLAASVLGLQVIPLRRKLFTISGAVGGISGILLFFWQGVLVPESAGVLRSVELVALAVVGGIQALTGPFLGAVVLEWLSRSGRFLGSVRELVFGVSFVVIVLFAPAGIVGVWQQLRRKFGSADAGRNRVDLLSPASANVVAAAPEHRVAAGKDARDGGLRILDVSKNFGGLAALSNVSMDVPYGLVTALVGANGAGKSTLLNIISGIEAPTRGEVFKDDENLGQLTPAERTHAGLARTFQVPRLVGDLTTLDNVALGADALSPTVLRRSRTEEVATRSAALDALRRNEILHLANRRAAELGSGEQKLVELTRALAWGGSILLMDEPATGLEISEIDALLLRIRDLADGGTAVLVIDHNMDFIRAIADHVYVLDRGEVIYNGDVRETLDFWTSRGV